MTDELLQQPAANGSAGKLRLLVLDDHALFRGGLARALAAESDMEVVAECATVSEALDVIAKHPVDVVLLDLELPGQHGGEFMNAFPPGSSERPRVLVVTGGVSEFQVHKLIRAGVEGLLLKKETIPMLCEAIRRVGAGQTALDSPWLRALVERQRIQSQEQKPLTPREREVLRGVVQGFASKEIAFQLNSTEPAVKSVIQQLFEKTGVRSRAQLVRLALEKYPEVLEE